MSTRREAELADNDLVEFSRASSGTPLFSNGSIILFICLIKIFPGEGEINVSFNETVNKNVFSKSNPTELNLLDKNFSAHEAENF